MRSIKRPLAATGTAVLLALSFAACGDDGDGKAGGDPGSEATATESSEPTESTGASGDAGGATDGSEATDGATGGAGTTGTATTEEFCAGVLDVVKVSTAVTTSKPDEAQWVKIQDAYSDLGEIGAPEDIPAREKEGFDIVVEAITSLSYAEAEKAFGDADGAGIPGVSAEENAKAEAFSVWAGKSCPELSGAGSGGSGTGGAPAE